MTHVDYSARVQTVQVGTNPRYYQLIRSFEEKTGCAVLVNTSFNVRGEPPVCHPREAIACFLDTGIDILALGNYVIEKSELPPELLRDRIPRTFAPD